MIRQPDLSWGPMVIAFLLLTPSLFAQGSQGTITGTVGDQSGALIPGVRVEARHLATSAVVTAVTNESGSYVLPFIPAGLYSITASGAGFKTLVRNGVQLHASGRLQLDLELELGVVSEKVSVSAPVDQLETATASRGQVLLSDRIRDLPLVGRNPLSQAMLTAGAYNSESHPATNQRPMESAAPVSLNGMRSIEVLINGMTNTGTENGGASNVYLMPSPDAVQELKVQTNVYDAQYGRTGGGYLSLVLKNGTNNLHGALYHYFRNDVLNANRFESNSSGTPRDGLLSNTPGVQFDGPVYIPKLYDGRNRTFFMYSWEAVRVAYPDCGSRKPRSC